MRSPAHRRACIAAAATLLALAAAAPAAALDAGDRVEIHGYGNWAYGKTDGNTYMNGTDEGSYDELEFSLAVAAEPSPNVAIHAQLFLEKAEEGAEASIDFAFAEYEFAESVKFRIGAVKQPFGIFTEIFDVGTVYPFVNLAQGIYGPAGLVSENYLGVGFTGRLQIGSGWGLQYDLYGGEMESEFTAPWEAEAEAEGGEAAMDVQDMVGGRLVVTTPGLAANCGLSAYTGTMDAEGLGEQDGDWRHTVVGAHVEWFQGPLTLRAEYAHADMEGSTSDGAYGEASWRFTPRWQVAARYDWSRTDLGDEDAIDDSLLEHQDVGLAVDYFFSPNMVLKLAYHMVDGNRFTSVDDEDDAQDEETTLVTAGVSFSF